MLVVGDDAQSIYSFRGAHFANILEFLRRYPDCQPRPPYEKWAIEVEGAPPRLTE